MTHRSFILAALGFLLFLTAVIPLHAETKALTEKAKIEALIGHVEALKDASFVRNGSAANSVTAGKFLRGKWQANDKDIKTAADFIAKAASVSSTTGKPYLIRFKDGTETRCGDYLTTQLKKLE
ncbi:MAG: DUF5329 family protein [Verrucomicrobiota bacterium]